MTHVIEADGYSFFFLFTLDIITLDQPFCCYPYITYMESVESPAVEVAYGNTSLEWLLFVSQPTDGLFALVIVDSVLRFLLSGRFGASCPYRASLLGRWIAVSGRTTITLL